MEVCVCVRPMAVHISFPRSNLGSNQLVLSRPFAVSAPAYWFALHIFCVCKCVWIHSVHAHMWISNTQVWKIAFVRTRWSVSPLHVCVCVSNSKQDVYWFHSNSLFTVEGWTPSRSAVTQTVQRSESKPNPGQLANWLQPRSFLRYCDSCATPPEGRAAEMSLWQPLVWLLEEGYFACLNFWTKLRSTHSCTILRIWLLLSCFCGRQGQIWCDLRTYNMRVWKSKRQNISHVF